MKAAPWILTAVIVAATAMGEWGGRERLDRALTEKARLEREPGSPSAQTPDDPSFDVASEIARLLELARPTENGEGSLTGEQSAADLRNSLAMVHEMDALDAGKIRILIKTLGEDQKLDDVSRANLLGLVALTLAYNDPEGALHLSDDPVVKRALDENQVGIQVQKSALARLADSDSKAAIEWLHRLEKASAVPVDEEIKMSVLAGVARQHPAEAFALIPEVHMERDEDAIAAIMTTPATPERRTEALKALRALVAGKENTDEHDSLLSTGIGSIESRISSEGLSRNLKWLQKVALTRQETEFFAQALWERNNSQVRDIEEDFPAWLAWMDGKLDPNQSEGLTADLVQRWAYVDAPAAAAWAKAAKPGWQRNGAIMGYIAALGSFQPEEALKWADLLEDQAERAQAQEGVLHAWMDKDPEAAGKYAAEHGH